jgi:xanthine dehydrogenase YagT iron-sulfur-binding subunit
MRGRGTVTRGLDGANPGGAGSSAAASADTDSAITAQEHQVVLVVNGERRELTVPPWRTLLDALRETLALTGAKKGCDQGACGACTVLVDGRRINACLTLAVMADGAEVTTVEGLARDGQLHPVQSAFLAHDGFQCGFCTPGQLVSAVALLAEGHAGSRDEIATWMSGNLCRCGAYPGIVAAIADAAGHE